jgi:hypothetical protein
MAQIVELPTPAENLSVRVSVGPSLSILKAMFQASLGEGFTIDDAFEPVPAETSDTRIAVLGTPELAEGELLIKRAGLSGVILVGVARRGDADGAWALALKLATAIRVLAEGIQPHAA